MQVFPIKSFRTNSNNKQMSFKGIVENNHYSEWALQNSQNWHKNSSVDRTVGSFHSNPTYKAYFAAPMEKVPDYIKETVDFVVYDNEPRYPDVNEDVSKNYFGTQRKNYKEDFEEIRQYYYRREMGGHADKAEAQYQQWQAAECVRLYDKAGDLRYKKETTEDEVKELERKIKQATDSDLPRNKGALEVERNLETRLNNNLNTLNQKNEKYGELSKIINEGADVSSYDEKYFVSSQRENVKKNIDSTKKELKDCQARIKKLETYIASFPEWLNEMTAKIKTKQAAIEGFKAKLIPLFDELKNFYVKQGIKVIK